MGWKKRNKKEAKKKQSQNEQGTHLDILWNKDCHKSKWVHISEEIKVFCGKPDRTTKKACCDELDVFFALSWGDYGDWKEGFFKQYALLDKWFSRSELKDLGRMFGLSPKNIIESHIKDGSIDEKVFKVIEATVLKGVKVGFGCLGGHGRTGWVLAKLLHTIGGHPLGDDLVKLTRDLLCVHAIETNEQIVDLGGKPMPPKYWGFDITAEDYEIIQERDFPKEEDPCKDMDIKEFI